MDGGVAVETVKLMGGKVSVQRPVREPVTQVNVRVSAKLAKRLRIFAIERDLRVQDIVAACIRAVVGTPAS